MSPTCSFVLWRFLYFDLLRYDEKNLFLLSALKLYIDNGMCSRAAMKPAGRDFKRDRFLT